MSDIVSHLIEDIRDQYDASDYDPDTFYDNAIDHFSIYGFDVCHKLVHESKPSDPYDTEEPHLEIITKLTTEEDEVNIRFILEDCTGQHEVPHIEQVDDIYEGLTDTDQMV